MRGWLGVGILVVFLVFGIVVSAVMNNAHLYTGELLTQATDLALSGAFEQAVTLSTEAKNRWEKHWNGTATVADHSPMDEVDSLFEEMTVYARAGEEPHFAACCKELSKRLEAMADAHKFSWWNVL